MDDSSDKTISLLIPEEEEVTENSSVSPESTSSSSIDHECMICFYSLKKKYTENDDNGDNENDNNDNDNDNDSGDNRGESNTCKGNNELDICICPFCATTFHSYCIYHWKKSQKGENSGCPKCHYMGMLHYVKTDTKYRILESRDGSESRVESEGTSGSEGEESEGEESEGEESEGESEERESIYGIEGASESERVGTGRREIEINIENGSATVTDRSFCRDCNFSSTLERTCCVIVFCVIIFVF